MRQRKRFWAMCIAVALIGLGLLLGLTAFLALVVFIEGPITPRSYSPEEKIRNRVIGSISAIGAVASFWGAIKLIRWGRRQPPTSQHDIGA